MIEENFCNWSDMKLFIGVEKIRPELIYWRRPADWTEEEGKVIVLYPFLPLGTGEAVAWLLVLRLCCWWGTCSWTPIVYRTPWLVCTADQSSRFLPSWITTIARGGGSPDDIAGCHMSPVCFCLVTSWFALMSLSLAYSLIFLRSSGTTTPFLLPENTMWRKWPIYFDP